MTEDIPQINIPESVCCRCDMDTKYINDILSYLNSIKEGIETIRSLLSENPCDKLRDFKNIAITRKYADQIMWGSKRISEKTVMLEREIIEVEFLKKA